ncbi:hypothetical protein SNARM312S_08381 [Streptomyces narbonensis]
MAAALAHRDDGEPALGGVGGRGGAGDGERGAQGRRRQVGELGGRLGDVGGAAHVPGRDGDQAAAVGDPQGDGVGGLGEAPLELGDARVQVGRLVGDEGLPVAGVAGQVVGERLGCAEDPEEPVPEGLGGEEGGGEGLPLGLGLGLDEPDQAAEGEVGVGGGAEGVEEDGVAAEGGQLRDVQEAFGPRGIGESVSQQTRECTAPAPRHRHPTAPSKHARPGSPTVGSGRSSLSGSGGAGAQAFGSKRITRDISHIGRYSGPMNRIP